MYRRAAEISPPVANKIINNIENNVSRLSLVFDTKKVAINGTTERTKKEVIKISVFLA